MAEPGPSRVVADLSHELCDGLPAYPGLPPARIGLYLEHAASREHYDGQAEFAIGRLSFVGNTGTYLDAPTTATGTASTSPGSPSTGSWTSRPS